MAISEYFFIGYRCFPRRYDLYEWGHSLWRIFSHLVLVHLSCHLASIKLTMYHILQDYTVYLHTSGISATRMRASASQYWVTMVIMIVISLKSCNVTTFQLSVFANTAKFGYGRLRWRSWLSCKYRFKLLPGTWSVVRCVQKEFYRLTNLGHLSGQAPMSRCKTLRTSYQLQSCG